MALVSADEFLSATKRVLERVHNGKFRETQHGAILNLIKKKRRFSLTGNGLRKIGNFSVLSNHRRRRLWM